MNAKSISKRGQPKPAAPKRTPLKRAEEILRRNDALFSTLILQAPVGVYVVDEQLRLRQVNPKAQPVFAGFQPLIGRKLSEIVRVLWPPKTAEDIMKRFQHTLKTGEAYVSPGLSERRHDTKEAQSYEWQIQRLALPAGDNGVVFF